MRLKQQGLIWRLLGVVWLVLVMINAAQARPVKQSPLPPPLTTKQEMSAHTDDLRTLMQQLYTEYPDELAKSTQVGPREMTEWVFDGKANWKFEGIRRLQGTDAISLVFDPAFTGDHIMALVVGLETLLFTAYGSQNEFEIPPERDGPRLAALQCQLRSVQLRLQANTSAGSVLSQAFAQQQVDQVLNSVLQRLQAQHLAICS